MELKDEDPPPFWLQTSTSLHHKDRRRMRHQAVSNLFLNTGVFVVFLLAAAVIFLAIVIPSVLSLARQVFNPSLVKSSWNSLNVVLVTFAIVCGFLGRKDEKDQTPVSSPMRREACKSVESSPRNWYAYQDSRMVYDNSFGNVDSMRRLRRSGSSYPDLRQERPWMESENRWRFYDDTQCVRSLNHLSRSRSMRGIDEDVVEAKNVEVVDTCVSEAKESTPPTAPPSMTPSPPPVGQKHVGSRDVEEDHDQCDTKNIEMGIDSESDPPEVLKSEIYPSPLEQQAMSTPSPLSPTMYLWPPPSPPPPPPPPPPRAQSSILENNKRNNPTNRESRSKIEMEMPPSSPGLLSQPWTPPSPLSPTNYFWPPPSPPPPPPPPPPQRTHSSILTKKKHENKNNSSKKESRSNIEVSPQHPPPPATLPRSKTKAGKSTAHTEDKKEGIVIRTLGRLPRRKRKHTRRSYENLTEIKEPPKVSIHRSKSTPEFPPTSPSRQQPPTSPPQPSIFQNIFSTKGKSKKKVHSLSTSSPPTRPPPPPSKQLHKTKITPLATQKPTPPTKTDSFSSVDENIGNGSESTLIPIPPPPPPPPPTFKIPSLKFVMHRDYLKTDSNNNSPRSGYSASEDEDSSPSNQKTSMFCPSPDVNTKADDFIARFRAKLTLEKLDSIKLNQVTRSSPLGPIPAGQRQYTIE